jgi:hypothetical protein
LRPVLIVIMTEADIPLEPVVQPPVRQEVGVGEGLPGAYLLAVKPLPMSHVTASLVVQIRNFL